MKAGRCSFYRDMWMCVCVCVLSMFECRNEDVPNVILFLVLGVLHISFEGSLFNMMTCIGDEGSSMGNTEVYMWAFCNLSRLPDQQFIWRCMLCSCSMQRYFPSHYSLCTVSCARQQPQQGMQIPVEFELYCILYNFDTCLDIYVFLDSYISYHVNISYIIL